MDITATFEFDDSTLEHPWHTYNLFDEEGILISRMYLRANHQPPENIKLYREEKDDE